MWVGWNGMVYKFVYYFFLFNDFKGGDGIGGSDFGDVGGGGD